MARRVSTLLVFVAIAAVIGYAAWLTRHVALAVGGSDSSGYANTARSILSGRIAEPIEALDRLELPDRFARIFIPLAFEPGTQAGTMVPYYPAGFPLHIAAAASVAGWNVGPFIVSPLAAVACLVLTFLLGHELGLSHLLAFAGAAILGCCAVFLSQAVQPMSDVAAACWVVAAVLFALRSRRRDSWALAAGAAFGMAVLVRPTNVLLALPIALALRWRPRAIVFFVLGGAPFGAFFLEWNQAAYGSPFRTGYSHQLIGELALANFVPRFQHYTYWISAQLSPLIPLGWLALAANRRVPGRDRTLIFLWFAAFFGFYCFWGPYDAWWYTRYLLPALPALIIACLLAARDLGRAFVDRGRPLRALAALIAFLAVAGFEQRSYQRLQPLGTGSGQAVFPEACRLLAARAAEGKALVVCMEFSGALRFYTKLTPVRWDRVSPEDFAMLRARALEKGYRVFGLMLPHEIDPAIRRVPGRWTYRGKVREASFWELGPDG